MTTNYKTLKDVQEFLNNIPFINYGGCGISALSMYRWLQKNNELKDTKFVYFYCSYDKKEYLNNKQVLRNGNGKPMGCAHACILHDGKFTDSSGVINNISKFKWTQIIDEEEFIKQSVNNVDEWNPTFNRESFLNNIEEELGIDLSDIKKRSDALI